MTKPALSHSSMLTGEAALSYAERFGVTVQVADISGVLPSRARALLARVQLCDRRRMLASVRVRIATRAAATT